MRIAFFVNSVDSELPIYTTTRLALEAHRQGDEVWYLGAGDITTLPDSAMVAHAVRAPARKFRSPERFLEAVQEADPERLELEALDVLMLRNDPAAEKDRPWAQHVGVDFAQVLASRGVIVLNDPNGLRRAGSKLYVQILPEAVRPRTVVTRNLETVRDFMERESSDVVLKPLRGSGGDRVFLVRRGDGTNLSQIFEVVAQTGYVIAQQYVAAAADGDVRLFVMNGRPLEVDGRIAAFKRCGVEGDVRNNMSAGGKAEAVDVTDEMLAVAEAVRPRLVEDGMFLVGLDIAGEHVLEINVFSPGGLGSCSAIYGADFCGAVVDAIHSKCELVSAHHRTFVNASIAVM